jgi:hypothetical protein
VIDWIVDRLRADPLRAGRVEAGEGLQEVRFAAIAEAKVAIVFVVDRGRMAVSVVHITGLGGSGG